MCAVAKAMSWEDGRLWSENGRCEEVFRVQGTLLRVVMFTVPPEAVSSGEKG